MRLFIAISIGDAARERIGELLPELKEASPKSKWVPLENVHLTVAFLGHLEDALVPEIARALDEAAARHPRLKVQVGGGGSFGGHKRPRVLWVGARAEDPAALSALVEEVERAMTAFGYQPEQRAYHPHVTVARARDPRGDAALATCAELLGSLEDTVVVVRELILMKSTVSSKGARYEPLHRARLK